MQQLNYTPTPRQLAQSLDMAKLPDAKHRYVLTTASTLVGWFPTQQGARVHAHRNGFAMFAIGTYEGIAHHLVGAAK